MSRIDPSIALGVKPTEIDSPVDSYGKALTMKSLLNTQALQQQELDEGRQRMDLNKETIRGARTRADAEERALNGQKALGAAFEAHTKIGDDGKLNVDHDAVEAELTRKGFPEQAILYNKQRIDYENAALDHAIKQSTIQANNLKKIGSLAQSVLNADESLRPALFTAALTQAGELASDESLQRMGLSKNYEGPKTDAVLQQLADAAAENPFKQAQDRLTAQQTKLKDDAKAKDDAAELLKKDVANESTILGTARSQEDWDKGLLQLRPERRKVYPAAYTTAAKNDAIYLGLNPKERAELGTWKSAAEMASAASAGDTKAAAALTRLQDYEAELEKRKEQTKNSMLLAGPQGTTAGDITGLGNVPGQRNEDVLKGVDPGTADTVRGIVKGIRPYPSSMAQRLPYWINVLNLAGRYEPGFDATKWAARQKTNTDFSAGASAKAINSLNMLAGHLDNLTKSIDNLDNFEGNTIISQGANFVRNGLTNKQAQAKFNTDVQAVSDEAESLMRNSGGSLEGVRGWKDNFGANKQPNVLKEGVSELVNLISSRFDALKQQYESVMNEPMPTNRITKHAREVYKKFGLDVDAGTSTVAAPPPAMAGGKPITEDIMAKARKANPGVKDDAIIEALAKKGYSAK